MSPSLAQRPGLDLLQIEDQLTPEERLVRDTVRAYTTDKVMPTSPTGSKRAYSQGNWHRNSGRWACSACT